uniref:SUN domain-containing protein n=1 Tax=Spongospora subterranea TaxID=70186 RepID=A0A0H5R6Z4_9EUKA|eukprot:CRZ09601.1 hypothetical protein [Spongospora subterranea]
MISYFLAWVVSVGLIAAESNTGLGSFNFASSGAGAKVLTSSPGASTPQNCLSVDPDRYLMIERRNRYVQWLVIQLSEDVTPKTISLQNLEFYSTFPNRIEVSASKSWPAEKFTLLAVVNMQKTRNPQLFDITTSHIYRFIKIRILSVHDRARVCTLTNIQVFGVPALQPAWTPLDESNADIEMLVNFRHHVLKTPQPIGLRDIGKDICPVSNLRTTLSSDSMLAEPFSSISQQAQAELSVLWDVAEPLQTSDHGSAYSVLMSRLQSIAVRQRLLSASVQSLLERTRPYLENLQGQLAKLDKTVFSFDAQQWSLFQKHSKIVQSSRLYMQCDMLSRAVPRLAERAASFRRDMLFAIYLAISAAVASVVLIVILLINPKRLNSS